MAIVNCSHPLHTGMQVYPGDPEVSISPALEAPRDGVNVLQLHMGSQSGTHVDSPFHVRNDLPTLEQLDLALFLGRAVVVDATGLEPRDTIPHERFASVDLTAVRIVLVRTDWSQYYGSAHYLAHPAPSVASLSYLLDHGIRTIGLDCLSLDITPDDPSEAQLTNHYLWSEKGGVIGENLTNLVSVTAATPYVSMLPLNLGASDGAPVRAIAFDTLD
jgi:kynurenine formamidase